MTEESVQPTNWQAKADELEAKYGLVEGYCHMMKLWTSDRPHTTETTLPVRAKKTDGHVRKCVRAS